METLKRNGSIPDSLNRDRLWLISSIVAKTRSVSTPDSSTINSSPAYRIAIPASGMDLMSIFPNVQIALSPVLWPKLSLIHLKSFTSIMIPYKDFWLAIFFSASTALKYLRLYNPESSSIYKLSAYDCICTNINATATSTHDDVIP